MCNIDISSLSCQDSEVSICKKPSPVSQEACTGTQLGCNCQVTGWNFRSVIVSQSTRRDYLVSAVTVFTIFNWCFSLLLLKQTFDEAFWHFYWELCPCQIDVTFSHQASTFPVKLSSEIEKKALLTFCHIFTATGALHFLSAMHHTVGSAAEKLVG